MELGRQYPLLDNWADALFAKYQVMHATGEGEDLQSSSF